MKKSEMGFIIWILLGVLFWLFLWAGASIILIFSPISVFTGFLYSGNRSLVYARILKRAAIIGGGFEKKSWRRVNK